VNNSIECLRSDAIRRLIRTGSFKLVLRSGNFNESKKLIVCFSYRKAVVHMRACERISGTVDAYI